jgi:DNA transformation protein
MARPPDEFTTHCLELLGSLGAMRARRMFSGQGIYADDVFVALIFDERLFLKTDSQTRERFNAAGGVPFSFAKQGETIATAYLTAPDDAMESPALMQPWARLALEAALRARAAKLPSARAKPKATPPAKKAKPRKPAARKA